MNTAGSPIVLQRRGSVYGANVPMITGKMNPEITFIRSIDQTKRVSSLFSLRQ